MISPRLTPTPSVERVGSSIRRLPGLRRLEWVWNAVRPYYDRLTSTIHPRGVEWNINGSDRLWLGPQLRMISFNHEPEAWRALMNEVRPGDLVADVGANIGLYSIALAKRIGPTGRVVAFEPDAKNFAVLKQHVGLNDLVDRIKLIQAALGAKDGSLSFSPGKGAYSHVCADETLDALRVECVTLDDTFSSRRVDVIKIDVEGYELEVLKGAVRLLQDPDRRPRFIYLELHPWAWSQIGVQASVESIVTLLQKSKYRVMSLNMNPLTEQESATEVVAVKSN